MKLETLHKDFIYHIYNRGINGCNIFINDENKDYFLKLLERYLKDKVVVYAYCLLDNHFHLLVKINEEEKIVTQAFSNFFNSYAKAFNKYTERTGSLFEKHFKRISVQDEDYIKKLIIYIHLNPKHHFNKRFEDFKYSSYRAFFSEKPTKLERKYILELFGDIENFVFVHNQKNELLEQYLLE